MEQRVTTLLWWLAAILAATFMFVLMVKWLGVAPPSFGGNGL
jgi:hypothetical protein